MGQGAKLTLFWLTIGHMDEGVVVDVSDGYISVRCGVCFWTNAEGLTLVGEDYRVGGEVWRVNKNDADPYPTAFCQ